MADWHSATYHGLRMQYFYVFNWEDLISEAGRSVILSAYIDAIERMCEGYHTIEQMERLADASQIIPEPEADAKTVVTLSEADVSAHLAKLDYLQRYKMFADEIMAMGGTFELVAMIGAKVFLPTFEEERTFKLNEIAFDQFIKEFESCRKSYRQARQRNRDYLLCEVLQGGLTLPEHE